MFIVLFIWGESVAFKILICGFAHFEFFAISLFLDVEFRIIFKTPSIVSSLRDCMQMVLVLFTKTIFWLKSIMKSKTSININNFQALFDFI